MTNNTDVPIWEKYTLTIEEASKYFRIAVGLRFIENELGLPLTGRCVVMGQPADGLFCGQLTGDLSVYRKRLQPNNDGDSYPASIKHEKEQGDC